MFLAILLLLVLALIFSARQKLGRSGIVVVPLSDQGRMLQKCKRGDRLVFKKRRCG